MLSLAFTMLVLGPTANAADTASIKRYYRSHGLGFLGELITDGLDELADERKRAKLELLADDARARAISQINRLLPSAKGEMQADLLARKAVLLGSRARTADYFRNNPFRGTRIQEPAFYLRAAITALTEIEKRDHGYPRMDEVLFAIAYDYGELKQPRLALPYHQALIRRFPVSPLVADSRLAIAEIRFDERRFRDCVEELARILEGAGPSFERLKSYALYRTAWARYNMGELDNAIGTLRRVVESVNGMPSSSGSRLAAESSASLAEGGPASVTFGRATSRAKLELRREALHDLVAFYSERSDPAAPADAPAYFEKLATGGLTGLDAKKTAPNAQDWPVSELQDTLSRLALAYRDHGRHDAAMTVAGWLITDLGTHPRVPLLRRLMAESASRASDRPRMLSLLQDFGRAVASDLPAAEPSPEEWPVAKIPDMNEFFALAATAAPPAPPLSRMAQWHGDAPSPAQGLGQAGPEATADVKSVYQRELARVGFETFRDFSVQLDREWDKTREEQTARAALRIYDLSVKGPLFSHCATDPNRMAACFDLLERRARLRLETKDWAAAAQEFRWLALHSPSGAADHARGQITALEALLGKSGDADPVREQLLAAYDLYLGLTLGAAPDQAPVARVVAASARLLRETGAVEQALSRSMFHALRFHDGADSPSLARDAAAMLEKAVRWDELRAFTERALATGAYPLASVAGRELERARQYATLKGVERLESAKNWKEASLALAAFARANPGSEFVSQALLKSASAALELGDSELAVARLEEASRAKDEATRAKARLGLEPFYRKSFQWEKLVKLYEAIGGQAAQRNLAAIAALHAPAFTAAGSALLPTDPELGRLIARLAALESLARPYFRLRFTESNENPNANFARKAGLHARLSATAEQAVDAAPARFKAGAAATIAAFRAELLLEFAETLESAAIPGALRSATAEERKAYQQAVASQAAELRAQAQHLLRELIPTLAKARDPLIPVARLNRVAAAAAIPLRVSYPAFARAWEGRPKFALASCAEESLEDLRLRILRANNPGEPSLRLAHKHWQSGQPGYAHAVASAIASDPEASLQRADAQRLRFTIDGQRIPAEILRAIPGENLQPEGRWQLAGWLLNVKNESSALPEDELTWFDQAADVLLHPLIQVLENTDRIAKK